MKIEQIKQFIIEQLEVYGPIETNSSEIIDLDSFNFIESGHIDSLGIMKFMIELEAEFDIKFTDEELLSEDFKTIDGLSNLINQNL